MLNLSAPTDPAWLARVERDLEPVLVDHAHCEKKAAAAALKLLFAYPHHGFLQRPLARLAREELAHFERVHRLLGARAIRYRSQAPSAYAARLHAHVRVDEPDRLVDVLLIGALIEARSCERFKLLSEGLADRELASFYAELLESEARHHGLYLELARQLVPEREMRSRLTELAEFEAVILAAPGRRVRLHS